MNTSSSLSTKHLLGIRYITHSDIQLIFQTAKAFKQILQRPIKSVPTLKALTIANLFFENSTRTRISFELAEKRLGANTINFSEASSSTKKGETLLDTVNNILSMKVDMVVIRHSSPGVPEFLSKNIDANIINAGDGTHEHPTQGLLDAFSMQEALNSPLKGKNIAIIGDITHSRVAMSNILCLNSLGANVRLCAPPTLIPPYIAQMGVEVSHNVQKTLEWCEVANVLRIQLERQSSGKGENVSYFPSLREYAHTFGISKDMLDALNRKIVLMHPGPINRGVELTSDAADSEHSIILNQVENGVAIRMAVLYLLAGNLPFLNTNN